MWIFDMRIHCESLPPLVTISMTSQTYLFFFGEYLSYTFGVNFNYIIIITMLYIISSDLIYLIFDMSLYIFNEKVYIKYLKAHGKHSVNVNLLYYVSVLCK